jgi:hypothetical protein
MHREASASHTRLQDPAGRPTRSVGEATESPLRQYLTSVASQLPATGFSRRLSTGRDLDEVSLTAQEVPVNVRSLTGVAATPPTLRPNPPSSGLVRPPAAPRAAAVQRGLALGRAVTSGMQNAAQDGPAARTSSNGAASGSCMTMATSRSARASATGSSGSTRRPGPLLAPRGVPPTPGGGGTAELPIAPTEPCVLAPATILNRSNQSLSLVQTNVEATTVVWLDTGPNSSLDRTENSGRHGLIGLAAQEHVMMELGLTGHGVPRSQPGGLHCSASLVPPQPPQQPTSFAPMVLASTGGVHTTPTDTLGRSDSCTTSMSGVHTSSHPGPELQPQQQHRLRACAPILNQNHFAAGLEGLLLGPQMKPRSLPILFLPTGREASIPAQHRLQRDWEDALPLTFALQQQQRPHRSAAEATAPDISDYSSAGVAERIAPGFVAVHIPLEAHRDHCGRQTGNRVGGGGESQGVQPAPVALGQIDGVDDVSPVTTSSGTRGAIRFGLPGCLEGSSYSQYTGDDDEDECGKDTEDAEGGHMDEVGYEEGDFEDVVCLPDGPSAADIAALLEAGNAALHGGEFTGQVAESSLQDGNEVPLVHERRSMPGRSSYSDDGAVYGAG